MSTFSKEGDKIKNNFEDDHEMARYKEQKQDGNIFEIRSRSVKIKNTCTLTFCNLL